MPRYSTLVPATILLLACGTAAGAQQPASASVSAPPRAELVKRLDSLSAAFVREAPAAGAAVAVVRGRDTLLLDGYGMASREANVRANGSHFYRLGSITKQYTAAAIMRLVEQGKLSLDDPLSKFVPEFPLQGHTVTIRQLLNHTSGIPSYTSDPQWRTQWAQDVTPWQIMQLVASDTFDFAPGTKWRYNNSGYVLLGMVIQKVTGQDYAAHVKQMVAPLGLEHTFYCPSRPQGSEWASGYGLQDGAVVPAEYISMTQPYAAGALCATPRDFLRWQRALASGRVVSPASYALMTTPDTLASGERLTYGFGLMSARVLGKPVITHGGGIHGFSTTAHWFPEDSLSVIVFANTAGSNPDEMAANLVRAVYGAPLVTRPKLPPAVALDAATRDALVGVYDLRTPVGGTFTIAITAEGEGLAAQPQGQGRSPLVHIGNAVFGASFDPTLRVTFERGADGRATAMTLEQRGGKLSGPRRP